MSTEATTGVLSGRRVSRQKLKFLEQASSCGVWNDSPALLLPPFASTADSLQRRWTNPPSLPPSRVITYAYMTQELTHGVDMCVYTGRNNLFLCTANTGMNNFVFEYVTKSNILIVYV